jgi:hypothetical protein
MKQQLNYLNIALVFLFALLTSCEDDVEINIGNIQEPVTAEFQVDFDNQTWIADRTTAIVGDNETIITGYKDNDQQKIVITLKESEVGSYIFSPNTEIGKIEYFESSTAEPFTTEFSNPIGRVDVTSRDMVRKLITGQFFGILHRLTQQLDNQGNPILDNQGNPVFNDETKSFTNGIFNNIVFTTEDIEDPDPDNNEFFVKLDGTEFVETTLTAEKEQISGVDIITIRATRSGSNEVIVFQLPADIVTGNNLLVGSTTDPANETVANYRILSLIQTYVPTSGNIAVPLLQISLHNITTNRIEGTFSFSAIQEGGTATHEFTEGSFAITYTE